MGHKVYNLPLFWFKTLHECTTKLSTYLGGYSYTGEDFGRSSVGIGGAAFCSGDGDSGASGGSWDLWNMNNEVKKMLVPIL